MHAMHQDCDQAQTLQAPIPTFPPKVGKQQNGDEPDQSEMKL